MAGENTMSDFKTERLSEGFDEVTERVWEPNQVVRAHSHPFAVHALVTAGEMWLTIGERVQHRASGVWPRVRGADADLHIGPHESEPAL